MQTIINEIERALAKDEKGGTKKENNNQNPVGNFRLNISSHFSVSVDCLRSLILSFFDCHDKLRYQYGHCTL